MRLKIWCDKIQYVNFWQESRRQVSGSATMRNRAVQSRVESSDSSTSPLGKGICLCTQIQNDTMSTNVFISRLAGFVDNCEPVIHSPVLTIELPHLSQLIMLQRRYPLYLNRSKLSRQSFQHWQKNEGWSCHVTLPNPASCHLVLGSLPWSSNLFLEHRGHCVFRLKSSTKSHVD